MHGVGDWRMFLALLSLHWSESISLSCGYWLFRFTTSGFSGPHSAALSWYRSSAHRHSTGQHHLDGVYSRYCLVFAPGCIGTGTRRDQSGEISWTVLSDDRCGVAQLCDLLTDPRQGPVYQVTARRVSLLLLGLGLCVFATSDFIFNVQQNAGTYVDGTWIDLGWPLGMMTIGVAAYLRRFLPGISGEVIEERMQWRWQRLNFGLVQATPYFLLAILFLVLVTNILSSERGQQNIRPVLLLVTLCVVGFVVVRQIVTLLDNERLTRKQATILKELEAANQRIGEHSAVLEAGVTHLKEIQTRLANGDVRARAHSTTGELWPLAVGLNLMADRMMRSEKIEVYARTLTTALVDLGIAFERSTDKASFVLPASCYNLPEIYRLLLAMEIKQTQDPSQPPAQSLQQRPGRPPLGKARAD